MFFLLLRLFIFLLSFSSSSFSLAVAFISLNLDDAASCMFFLMFSPFFVLNSLQGHDVARLL